MPKTNVDNGYERNGKKFIGAWIDKETFAEIDKICKETGMNRADVIRKATNYYAWKRQNEREPAFKIDPNKPFENPLKKPAGE